jgi:hypothetical protein
MAIQDDYKALTDDEAARKLKVKVIKRIMSGLDNVQALHKELTSLADTGIINEFSADIKAELVFFYQSLTALKDALTGRASFMEFYNAVRPPFERPGRGPN